MSEQNWVSAGALSDLQDAGQKVFKHEGKQILLLAREDKLYACNNRCPHEGYPLAEGTTSQSEPGTCMLTCNWHNWQFDLSSGEALVGGDAVRLYETEVREGDIMIDVSDPPKGALLPKIMNSLDEAFDDYDYSRIARELVRYQHDEGDPKDVLRHAIERSHNRFEYGVSHAYASAADWLSLSEKHVNDEAKHLISFVEPAAHMAWDTLRHPEYPYTDDEKEWDEDAFVAAIEITNEDEAVALFRGAVSAGVTWQALEPAFARAALAHYQDFGHAAIYTLKIGELIKELGPKTLLPAGLAFTRELIFASREDLIPDFRAYHDALQAWDGKGETGATTEDFIGLNVKAALTRTLASSAHIEDLYTGLLGANAWNFLHFDTSVETSTDNTIARNVGWLDFTHGITFANAVRQLCTRYPVLWPQGLLQMACFLGRNSPLHGKNLRLKIRSKGH